MFKFIRVIWIEDEKLLGFDRQCISHLCLNLFSLPWNLWIWNKMFRLITNIFNSVMITITNFLLQETQPIG